MSFLAANLGNIVIIAVLLLVTGMAVRSILKDRKKGSCSCGGSCSSCSAGCSCHSK